MNIKKAYIALGLSVLTFSTLIGCNKQAGNNSAIPTMSDSILAIEIPEPEPVDELGNEVNDIDTTGANGTSQDIVVEGELVEGTTLTQEEIDALRADAKDVMSKRGIDAYESIINTGSWTNDQGAVATKVVGKPGDTSWRQMTDEEAQAYQEKYPYSDIGYAELNAGTWNISFNGTVYFNPYEYEKAARASQQELVDSGKAWDPEDIVIDH